MCKWVTVTEILEEGAMLGSLVSSTKEGQDLLKNLAVGLH